MTNTIKNFSQKIKINGEFRDASFWSVVVRLNPKNSDGSNLFNKKGSLNKSCSKGKPATFWEISDKYSENIIINAIPNYSEHIEDAGLPALPRFGSENLLPQICENIKDSSTTSYPVH